MDQNQDPTPLFVLAAAPTPFWWTVRIPSPGDNSYSFAKLDLQFAPCDQTELDKMQGIGLAVDAEGKTIEQPPTDTEICHAKVLGWRNFNGPGLEPVPFSAQMLDEVLKVPMAKAAIVATYIAAMRGLAARKNA